MVLLPLLGVLLQAPATQTASFFDFPPADSGQIWAARHGETVKLAKRSVAQRTDTADALKAVFDAGMYPEALDMLERIINAHPDRMAAALQIALAKMSDLSRGTGDQAPRLQTLADLAASKLATLGREEAARVARQLVGIRATTPHPSYDERLAAFAREYVGTEAGDIADVQYAISRKSTTDIIAIADRIVDEHPRSVVGARALYEKGFQLSTNVAITGVEPRGSDPTARFMQVAAIVKRLESGEFPECEWTRRAPELISGFFSSEPHYAPGNAERVLDVYYEHVKAHWQVSPENPLRGGSGYVIAGRMRDLFKAVGDPDGVERTFLRLEKEGPDPDGARYMLALFYLGIGTETPPSIDATDRAIAMLDELRSRSGPYAAKALSTLAFLRFQRGDFAEARTLFSAFVSAYPRSSYSWLASIHGGQSAEMLGDFEGAASTYEVAARANDGAGGMAGAVAWSLAAEAHEGVGQIGKAAAAMARAVAAWDPDYGIDYTITVASKQPSPRATPTRTVSRREIETKSHELSVLAATPGGPELGRAHWSLMKERREEAATTAQAFLRRYPGSRLAADAHYVLHRARFEIALERGNVEAPAPGDPAEIIRLLAAVDDGTWDTAVALSKIAKASLAWRQKALNADTEMASALREWQQRQIAPAAADDIARDVAEIREVVFRPTGGGIYANSRGGWNAFSWPSELPRYVMVDPVVRVKLADGTVTRMTAARGGPAADRTIFLGVDEQQGLSRILARLGGTRVGVPQSIMIMNAPVGGSMEILDLWKRFFPTRPGHWFGWEFTTYPQVTEVAFVDAARTRAAAKVTVGYSGATVLLEKRDGRWIPIEMKDYWIT